MTEKEFNILERLPYEISINDLSNKEARTLIWGYTANRESYHVYLLKRQFHVYVYDGWNPNPRHFNYGNIILLEDCLPNKRIHPEACDFEFCSLLKSKGVELNFTYWNPNRPDKQFYGELG